MMTFKTVTAEMLNTLYNDGYKYMVKGNYQAITMDKVNYDYNFFKNKEEAENFAEKQVWPYNKEVKTEIEEIPAHTETIEEAKEREAKEKAEKKAREEEKERKKAEEAGMTLEEYRKDRKDRAMARKLQREIEELKKELAKKEAMLKKYEKRV